MSKHWYALQSKPQKEEALAAQLRLRQVETFYPFITVKPVNPRSRTRRPYFPGYMFVHVDLSELDAIVFQRMPFAKRLVSFDNEPAPVPENLVNALKYKVWKINEGKALYLLEGLQPGEPVVIQDGTFSGYEAIFDASINGSERVRVLLQFLGGRKVSIELPAGYIQRKQKK
jgi:transcriptional antiterminator RfaH